MMDKFLIVIISLALLMLWVAESWAHGPGGSRTGTLSYGYKKPSFHRPLYQQPRTGLPKHYGPLRALRPTHYGYALPHIRYPYLTPTSQRLPRIEKGVLYSKPGPLQTHTIYSPLIRAHNRGIGVSPLRKAIERKALRKAPRHFPSPQSFFFENPDPWFLYGKGDELRRMGILPPKAPPSR